MEQILPLLPASYACQLQEADFESLEELRLRMGQPLQLRYAWGERAIWPAVDRKGLEDVLGRACRQSIYAHTDSLRQGYVTVEGGHRIGVCGFGVRDGDAVRTIRSPSSLNIRIARQIYGCANDLLPQLHTSTLIIGPPGCGKTTLLRDAVCQLSDKQRQQVGLADERGEISATADGQPQLQVGCRTDVLVNIPKSQAVMQLIRTMSPQWVALDEITDPHDLLAMEQAAYCGVQLLATAHGNGVQALRQRPLYRQLMKLELFSQLVLLQRDKTYTIEEVSL